MCYKDQRVLVILNGNEECVHECIVTHNGSWFSGLLVFSFKFYFCLTYFLMKVGVDANND